MATTHQPLASLVQTALDQSPYLASRTLRCETHEGHVVLHGHVASYFQKQMAQEALRRVQGVERIENRLEVTGAY